MIHIAVKYNIADPLSCLLGDTARKTKHAHGVEEYVRFVAVQATPRALTTREVERASAEDEELVEVRKEIQGQFKKCSAYVCIANKLYHWTDSVERDTDCPTTDPTEQL